MYKLVMLLKRWSKRKLLLLQVLLNLTRTDSHCWIQNNYTLKELESPKHRLNIDIVSSTWNCRQCSYFIPEVFRDASSFSEWIFAEWVKYHIFQISIPSYPPTKQQMKHQQPCLYAVHQYLIYQYLSLHLWPMQPGERQKSTDGGLVSHDCIQ